MVRRIAVTCERNYGGRLGVRARSVARKRKSKSRGRSSTGKNNNPQTRRVVKTPEPIYPRPGKSKDEPEFDVALSYAGEDRQFVESVSKILSEKQVRVFYDKDEREQVELWGKDLGDRLDAIYRLRSKHVVMFISKYYAQKMWTNHERKSSLARALQVGDEYVLPARFDQTELLGLRPTTAYIDLTQESPESFARKIILKIGATRALEDEAVAIELPTVSRDIRFDIADVGGYVILGIEDEKTADLLSVFGEDTIPVTMLNDGAIYEDVHFTDLNEMNEVFSALNVAVTEAQLAGVSGADRQAALERTLIDLGIARASRYIFSDEHTVASGFSDVPGLKYVIWGIRRDWVPVLRLLRPREHLESPKRLVRNAHEVYFRDLPAVKKIPGIIQSASERSNGNQQEFMRLLFEDALRLRVSRPMSQTPLGANHGGIRLHTYLSNQPSNRDKVELSISEVQKIIGKPLPILAFQRKTWWANDA
jgi:hypothetical protein